MTRIKRAPAAGKASAGSSTRAPSVRNVSIKSVKTVAKRQSGIPLSGSVYSAINKCKPSFQNQSLTLFIIKCYTSSSVISYQYITDSRGHNRLTFYLYLEPSGEYKFEM